MNLSWIWYWICHILCSLHVFAVSNPVLFHHISWQPPSLPAYQVKYHTEDASAIAGREFEACSGRGEVPIQSRWFKSKIQSKSIKEKNKSVWNQHSWKAILALYIIFNVMFVTSVSFFPHWFNVWFWLWPFKIPFDGRRVDLRARGRRQGDQHCRGLRWQREVSPVWLDVSAWWEANERVPRVQGFAYQCHITKTPISYHAIPYHTHHSYRD